MELTPRERGLRQDNATRISELEEEEDRSLVLEGWIGLDLAEGLDNKMDMIMDTLSMDWNGWRRRPELDEGRRRRIGFTRVVVPLASR